MAIRTKEQLRSLKRDKEGKYDVAYGKMFRSAQGKTTVLTPQIIASNENLNELFDLIIKDAINIEARNIEIYKDAQGYGIVQFRVGRDMVDDRLLDPDAVDGLGIVCRKRANVNIEQEYRSEINGSIRYRYMNKSYDLRCAFLPTIQGMSMSIRILYSSTLMRDVSNLGFPPNVEDTFRSALKSNQGMILITGGTSSGKTTTQYTGLNTIMQEDGLTKNIRTVENPVEYTLPGVKQTQVNEEVGETFSKILKSFLRGDPNIILVGEINDAETALTAVRAATSGHLVMSTLHTNNTIEVTRVMQHYGASYIDLGNALQLVMNQVLENKLCPACRTRRPVTEEEFIWIRKRLGVDDNITVLYEKAEDSSGCKECEGIGYKGATLIVEMLETDYAYQRALNIAKDNTFELEKLLLEDENANFYPMGRDVFRHLKAGHIDIETAKRIMKKQTSTTLNEEEKGR